MEVGWRVFLWGAHFFSGWRGFAVALGFSVNKNRFWWIVFWALVLGKSFSFPSDCSFFRVCVGFFWERGFLGMVSSSLAGLGFHSVIVGLTC